MADPRPLPASSPAPLPIAPSVEQWRAMSPEERERFVLTAFDALNDPLRLISEGRPHKLAKSRVVDMLGLHFKALGRIIYVAEEMAVFYPDEEVFTPDVLAVLDVEQPDDDQRMAWVIADEGRGLDLAFEVLHRGDRKKDLVDNVERYARLGIAEYFIYDWGKQQLYGYRLTNPGSSRYQRIVPQSGRYHSEVLGLDLVLERGRLRFYQGMAELIGSDELIDRLTDMVGSLEAKAEHAEAKFEEAQAEAERAKQTAEQANLTAEQANLTAEQAQAQLEEALACSRENVLAMLATRLLPCTDEIRTRVMTCEDLQLLQRWLLRTLSAKSSQDVFGP
jgi:Uma2 family endonuclease